MGEKVDATFVIHMSSDENSSWQGQITWADTSETVNFRSALELIKLMDKAVNKSKNNNF